ncbi:MAG: response regulator [Synergistaceae bacterium]|nr:response regulator [Synergistaceae bacterium]
MVFLELSVFYYNLTLIVSGQEVSKLSMKNMKIGTQIILITFLIAIITILGLSSTSVYYFSRYARTESQKIVRQGMSGMKSYIDEQMTRVKVFVTHLADNEKLAVFVADRDVYALNAEMLMLMQDAGIDILTVSDENGMVILRAHDPENIGDDLSGNEIVKRALEGQAWDMLTEGVSTRLGYYCGIPIKARDGEIVGTIIAAVSLTNEMFVDRIKALFDNEVTLFAGKTRINTTLIDVDGMRLIGTDAPEVVQQTVLRDGNDAELTLMLFGKEHFTIYSPLKDPASGKIMGMYFNGRSTEEAKEAIRSTVMTVSAVSVIVFAAAFLISVVTARRISKPLGQIVAIAERTRGGDLTIKRGDFNYDGGGELGVLVDAISDMISAQLKAMSRAEAANKAKSEFLSTMSHEMRTPMNVIIGMTTIGKKTDDMVEKNHALGKIEDASSHLLGVINDVLDMAKIEANKLELAPVEYNFERMLQKVIAVVNFRVNEKQQTLTVNVDNNIPDFIVGDAQRLAQVITNLLSNAVKFTPEKGKICLEASLAGESDGDCELRIEVTDSGIGISAPQQEKLFKAFEQAESGTSRLYGGTGLGLVISKRIVELMDGGIWIESELGKGAKFTFTVRARRGEKSFQSLLAAGVNWETVRILLVDDVLEIRNQFRDIFSPLNIKCDVAADGFEACRIIEERGEYDIYFIDWRMGGMDGIELTRRIKSRRGGRPSVVIMITAMDWEQIKCDASDAGVDKHLLKPLFSSMIIDCINECLGMPRKQSEDVWNAEGEFTGKRLLLAEDIEINREILMALLEGTGLDIYCAENGEEALAMVTEGPCKYDMVFMDVQMPKMDGLEATRRIRALPGRTGRSGGRLPIVAMTANVFKSDIEDCLAAGMDDHLGKPIDTDKLLETLRKYLGE